MESMTIDILTLFFDAEEHEAAELAQDACQKSIRLIREQWDLDTPRELRVYVMTSWLHFIFHSAPWFWQPLLVLSLPFWYRRIKNLWRYAGGWAQRYGKRCAIGVKPARLIQQTDKSLGDRFFVQEDSLDDKIRHITCHELTHAFTAHLKLPMWLNEGLAVLMMDRLFGRQIVKQETLDILARPADGENLQRVRKITGQNLDAVVYLFVRGYWITRYLEDVRPGLIKDLLAQRHSHVKLENKIAGALDMDRETFWRSIDGLVVAHFDEN